ncbi:hypothetical protein Prudu_006252, partial [Prunus dulcis]
FKLIVALCGARTDDRNDKGLRSANPKFLIIYFRTLEGAREKKKKETMNDSNSEISSMKPSNNNNAAKVTKPPFVPAKDDTKPVLQDPILRSDPIETEEAVIDCIIRSIVMSTNKCEKIDSLIEHFHQLPLAMARLALGQPLFTFHSPFSMADMEEVLERQERETRERMRRRAASKRAQRELDEQLGIAVALLEEENQVAVVHEKAVAQMWTDIDIPGRNCAGNLGLLPEQKFTAVI